MLRHWIEVTESLLNEVDIFLVVLDTTGNDEALSWRNRVHDELLHHSCIDVVNVLGSAKSWHTESVVTISSSEKELLVHGKWIVFLQVVEELVRFLVLGPGNVSGENGSWLEGDINHHLEHIDDIVLDAVSLEIGSLLVIIHGHGSTGHLDHTVVNCLVSVFKGLKVSILEGK